MTSSDKEISCGGGSDLETAHTSVSVTTSCTDVENAWPANELPADAISNISCELSSECEEICYKDRVDRVIEHSSGLRPEVNPFENRSASIAMEPHSQDPELGTAANWQSETNVYRAQSTFFETFSNCGEASGCMGGSNSSSSNDNDITSGGVALDERTKLSEPDAAETAETSIAIPITSESHDVKSAANASFTQNVTETCSRLSVTAKDGNFIPVTASGSPRAYLVVDPVKHGSISRSVSEDTGYATFAGSCSLSGLGASTSTAGMAALDASSWCSTEQTTSAVDARNQQILTSGFTKTRSIIKKYESGAEVTADSVSFPVDDISAIASNQGDRTPSKPVAGHPGHRYKLRCRPKATTANLLSTDSEIYKFDPKLSSTPH